MRVKNSNPKPARRPPVLKVVDVAEKLGVSDAYVRGLIEEGKLPAINVGSRTRNFWRIPITEFNKFVGKRSSLNPEVIR